MYSVFLLDIVFIFVIPPPFTIIVRLIVLADVVVDTVIIFMLAIKVYHIAVGIILGILTLVPCLGLLVLLLINSKATSILIQNGFKVGLLGDKLSTIDSAS